MNARRSGRRSLSGPRGFLPTKPGNYGAAAIPWETIIPAATELTTTVVHEAAKPKPGAKQRKKKKAAPAQATETPPATPPSTVPSIAWVGGGLALALLLGIAVLSRRPAPSYSAPPTTPGPRANPRHRRKR